MFGITAILGAWGAGTLGQSDWTRYSRRRFAPTLSQLVAAPVTITVTAIIGIVVTSAAKDILGTLVWNPIYLLADIQEEYHSDSKVRAGVFFASLGLVSSQLAVGSFSLSFNHLLTARDIRGAELRLYRNGSRWLVPEIHQHHPRKLHYGGYRYMHAVSGICTSSMR
jgi:NCS1 family nucleobase:cation symporter-1